MSNNSEIQPNFNQMDAASLEHDKVVRAIISAQGNRFKILTNVDGDKNFISGIFPDILLLDKETDQTLFIIEVKRNGQIASCIQQWKSLTAIPATLYIVVPESDLSSAKLVAASIGLKAKFGTYTYKNETPTAIHFES